MGEISKLIDWAQSTSPLPPTMGGRTSPAGYSSLMNFGRWVGGPGVGRADSSGFELHAGLLPSPGLRLQDACLPARLALARSSPHARALRRLSFGGDKGGGSSNGALPSPLGDATNQARQGSAPSASRKAAPSPCKPTLQVPSPSGRSPLTSPSKVR